MKLVEFSVKRRVTTIMIFLGVILMGFISLRRLPQELFPSLSFPQITVVTTYENAAPEEMETLITKIIEEAVGTVQNLKRISSVSREGISIVTAEFGWNTDMNFAALGVREKIDLVKDRLPLESGEPVVMKFNPFSLPVMILSVTGRRSSPSLLRVTRRIIKDRLEKVDGVASAVISGGQDREIIVEVNQGELQARNIPLLSIVDSLKESNLNYPAGTVKEDFYEWLVRTMGEVKTVGEIGDTVVKVGEELESEGLKTGISPDESVRLSVYKQSRKSGERRFVLLKHIAEIKDGIKEKTSVSRYNGQDNISVAIQKQAEANTLETVDLVKQELNNLKNNLPSDVEVMIVYDQSKFIEDAISGVLNAGIGGGILAFIVLFFFLRDYTKSLIVTTAIPISIMAVFSFMYFIKININMMSMGGLALGIGMLVDNAIVVIENISRHKKIQKDSNQAAIVGASEVGGAITSSTLTTVAVFLPLIFVVGIAGQLFKELSYTITFSLLASLSVALMLIPRLAATSKVSKKESGSNNPGDDSSPRVSKIMDVGKKILGHIIENRLIFIGIVLALLAISVLLLISGIDSEFLPKIDQREFIVKADLPMGTRLEMTDSVVRKIEGFLSQMPEVKSVTVNIGSQKEKAHEEALETLGSHQAQIIVGLYKKNEFPGKNKRQMRRTSDVIQRLKADISNVDLSGAEIDYVLQDSVFKSMFQESAPLVVEVKGPDLDVLRTLVRDITQKINKINGIYGVKTSLVDSAPETKFIIDKDRASSYSLSVNDIARTALIAIKGYVATKYKEEGREIDVKVRLRKADRDKLSKLRGILIHSPLDVDVPISEVAQLSQKRGPSEIRRLDQQRVVLISANVFKRSVSEVLEEAEGIIARVNRLTGYTVSLAGERKKIQESFSSLKFILILAIILVYMIMAAQFESLWQPFIIMFTVPLAGIGVVFALYFTGTSLSAVAFLGMIILGGIVVNNGIVLIDYINKLKEKNIDSKEAVIQASMTRLRPILMTTLTTTLALIPLAMGIGEGAELRSPMAIAVIGGLLASTFLTLGIIPIIYLMVEQFLNRFKRKEEE